MALLDRFKKKKTPVETKVGLDKKIPSTNKEEKVGKYANILIKPHITEKSTMGVKLNKYIFEVPLLASKIEIAATIKTLYDVKPLKVNSIKLKGKNVTFKMIKGTRKDRKLAIVTLPKDTKLNIYEGT